MLKLLSCRFCCMVYSVRELFLLKENLMRESLAYIQTDLVRTLAANILRKVFPHTLTFYLQNLTF